ncbi:MAG: hypothetical protein ABI702_25705 [Burkholderiales bacterium]
MNCGALAAGDLPALQRIGVDVWRIPAARGEPDESNRGATVELLLARDGSRLWLVGSGPTPAYGAALACAVKALLGRRVSDVVNTRAAPELAMGNAAFDGARVWALPAVTTAMRERCEACRERLARRLGAAGASLRPDLVRVPTAPVGRPGATAGSLGPFAWRELVRAPDEPVLVLRHRASGIVLAQGLVWAGDVPDLRDTRSDTLRASLRTLRRLVGTGLVLGEQGGLVRGDAIDAQIAYIDALRHEVRETLARGDVQGAAGRGIELPAFVDLPGYATRHPLNVQRVWRELESQSFDDRADQSGRPATFQRSLR